MIAPLRARARLHNRFRAPVAAAALLTLSACANAESPQEQTPNEPHAHFETVQREGALPKVAQARAWIQGTTLTIEAIIETRCMNDTVELTGGGGFGVTGRTYLVDAVVTPQPICLSALGRKQASIQAEIAPNAQYDDAMIRLEHELTPVPLEHVGQ